MEQHSNETAEEAINMLLQVPRPPEGYCYSNRQQLEQFEYFRDGEDEKMPNLEVDLYDVALVAVRWWTVWDMECCHLFKDISITSNAVEGINLVFKELTNWKTISVDRLLLLMNFLQGFYSNEVCRGFCGIGGYSLKPGYARFQMDVCTLRLLEDYTPEVVLQRVRDLDLTTETNDLFPARQTPLTSVQLSEAFINVDQVELTKSGVYVVSQRDHNTKMVTLLEKGLYNCSCGYFQKCNKHSDCIHIIAVKRRMNLSLKQPTSAPTIASVRRGYRAELGVGRTGNKQPTVLDKENDDEEKKEPSKSRKEKKESTRKRTKSTRTATNDDIQEALPPTK
ncbi:unnamed protein product, partial [Didymodactylos carnosus]